MMNSKSDEINLITSNIDHSQQKAAKIAGTMFLLLILLYFAEQLIISHIDSATVKRITELSIEVIYLICTLVLIFSLYRTLKPVNKKPAQIAMSWRLGESIIVLIMMIFGFEGKTYTIWFNISSILFSIGSLIFFYLFFKSKYIPVTISLLGIFASALVLIVGFATIFISPSQSRIIQYGWIPMLIVEITTGTWLIFKGLRSKK